MHSILRAHFGWRLFFFFFWNVDLVYKYRHGGVDRDHGGDMDQRKVRDGLTKICTQDPILCIAEGLLLL